MSHMCHCGPRRRRGPSASFLRSAPRVRAGSRCPGPRARTRVCQAAARMRSASWSPAALRGSSVAACSSQSQLQAPVTVPRRAPSPVPGQGRAGQARPSLIRISPTPGLHVLTTPLEPAKSLAHLHGRPTRRSRGGPRSTPPPFSIAGAPPDVWNDKNRTPSEPTPLPRPFPAKHGLPLTGFRPSSFLSAARLHCRGQSLSRVLDARFQGPDYKRIIRVFCANSKIH
jgi:hypothetical protein